MNEVAICNLALSHLGDVATVTSISPPEGSAQAEHCARYYPIARDALLEMHSWGFATRREVLALLADTMDQWEYVYAWPNKALKILSVILYDVENDYEIPSVEDDSVLPAFGTYAPQPFVVETLAAGTRVILTDQETALARFIVSMSDTTLFPPLFSLALSWLLASMLAGPILKGKEGSEQGLHCYKMFAAHLAEATGGDSNQRNIKPSQLVPWIVGR